MTELHCTGCLKLVSKDHKCKSRNARLIELGTMTEAKPKQRGYAEILERLSSIENKLNVILAMADKRRKDRLSVDNKRTSG